MTPTKYISNQFPIPVKQKAASWNLIYNGMDVVTNVAFPICKSRRIALVKAGLHKDNLFKYTPNF